MIHLLNFPNNFLNRFRLYVSLTRNPANTIVQDEMRELLKDVPGLFDSMMDYINGDRLIRATPIMWHPASANWALHNIRDNEFIAELLHHAKDVDLVLTGFQQFPVEYKQEWIDEIAGRKATRQKEYWEAFLDGEL